MTDADGNLAGGEPRVEHADVAGLSLDTWRERLLRSVDQPVQDGRRYPDFPDEAVQKAFVGSAWNVAINEACDFHRYVTDQRRRLEHGGPGGGYLDFGGGWGRIARCFLHDFERADMAVVDVDPEMVAFCERAGVPGRQLPIRNGEPLPFPDGSFRLVTAYSVFTHLPEPLFGAWMRELLRVTAPGGLVVFTVEPPRFLDFVAAIDPATPESGWHAGLAAALGDVRDRRTALARVGFTYLATGGGPHREADVYGDMVVTPGFVRRAAEPLGELVDYLDDPDEHWQALAVVRRRAEAGGDWRGRLTDPVLTNRPRVLIARSSRRLLRRVRRLARRAVGRAD